VTQTTQTATIPSTGGTVANTQLIGSVARDGVAWTYTYGNLTWEAIRGYWYDSLTVVGPNGYRRVYGIGRSEQHNVLTGVTENVTASTTRQTQYRYTAAGQVDRITYPELNQVTLLYDEFGNITSQTTTPKPTSGQAASSQAASYRSDCDTVETSRLLCYRPTWSRDALNRQTDYAYNAAGQLTEQTDPADASGVRRRTITEYETTATGISRRNVVRVCGTGAACGTTSEIRTEYDYVGNTILVAAERHIDQARGITLTTSYTYDAAGRVLAVDGPLPGTGDAVYSRYDAFGRKVREVGPLAPAAPDGVPVRLMQEHTYRDADDRITRTNTTTVTAPDSTTPAVLSRLDYLYDTHRNPIREKVWVGTTIYSILNRRFDDRGQLECEAVRMNPAVFTTVTTDGCVLGAQGTGTTDYGPDRITHNVYDSAGQLLQVQRAYGVTTASGFPVTLQQNYATYTYSPNGQRTSVTDANGNKASMTYDGFDRQIRWNFPSPTTDGVVSTTDYEAYTYDAVGNRLTLRKRDNSTLTYQYDNLNRMIVKVVPERTGLDPTHTRDVYYAYNVLDLETQARFDSGSGPGVLHSYDALGRLLTETVNLNGTRNVNSTWDAGGRRTRITHPDGRAYTYDYDDAGRLTGLYEGTAVDPTALLAGFTYTPRGLPYTRSEGGSSVDYRYDAIGRMTSMTDAFTGGSGNVAYTFAYTPASQMRARTRNNDSYDWTGGVAVDRGYQVNGLNQYLRTLTPAGATATAFTYDANGNLITSGSTTYTYDVENRLISASGGQTANLRYDPLGRLYEVVGASGTRRFVYDGDALTVEYTDTGTVGARFVHGPNPGSTTRWCGSAAARTVGSTPTTRARSSRSPRRTARCAGSTAMTNGAFRTPPATPAGSSIPARRGSPSSACTTTRRGCIRRHWAGSCRRIRWGMRIRSISMLMSAMIRRTERTRQARRGATNTSRTYYGGARPQRSPPRRVPQEQWFLAGVPLLCSGSASAGPRWGKPLRGSLRVRRRKQVRGQPLKRNESSPHDRANPLLRAERAASRGRSGKLRDQKTRPEMAVR
jgi:YD repeat-containing protein